MFNRCHHLYGVYRFLSAAGHDRDHYDISGQAHGDTNKQASQDDAWHDADYSASSNVALPCGVACDAVACADAVKKSETP